MEPGPTFMKLRMFAFCCMILVSLLWLVLLNIDIFLRWDVSDPAQRSFVIVFIIIDALTVIMLPVMLIVKFRIWLESARLAAFVLAHFSVAVAYTIADQKFECPHDTPDDDGVCEVIDLYILLASWVIPALLLAYTCGFGIFLYRHRELRLAEQKETQPDVEASIASVAEIQVPVLPPRARASIGTHITASTASRYSQTTDRHMSYKSASRPGWLDEDPVSPDTSSSTAVHVTTSDEQKTLVGESSSSKKSRSSRTSNRLSKRLPESFFS